MSRTLVEAIKEVNELSDALISNPEVKPVFRDIFIAENDVNFRVQEDYVPVPKAVRALQLVIEQLSPSKKTFETEEFKGALNKCMEAVNKTAHEKGWYEEERNLGEVIALMHSELSEALEGLREKELRKSEKIPDFLNVEEEFADTVIRIMDTCKEKGWDLAGAIVAKMAYNSTRPHRHGGKKF